MSRKTRNSLLASALVAAAAVVANGGCSSSSGGGPVGGSSSGGLDASHPIQHVDASGLGSSSSGGGSGSGASGDGAVPYDGTTGKACTTDADCSPTGLGINKCSPSLYTMSGPVWPTSVCLPSVACDPGADNFIHYCDGPDDPSSPGICYPNPNGGGDCFPQCNVNADGAAITGCLANEACSVFGSGVTTSGKPVAVGFCSAACSADSQCPAGSKCQRDQGVCLTTVTTPTKKVGDPCSANDAATVCNCYQNQKSGVGYCTEVCVVGAVPSQCPAGYVCDAQLPSVVVNAATDASVNAFTVQNTGLAGVCLQACGGGADAGGDAASTVIPACPVTATCSTLTAGGPDCVP